MLSFPFPPRWNASPSPSLCPSIRPPIRPPARPCPPCPSPSAAARVFRSIRQIHFARFPFLRIDSACGAIGTNGREKVIASRKKPSKSNDRRAEEEEEMYRSFFSLSPVHSRVPPFPFLVLNEAITRLERSRENKGRGFNGGRSGTKRCWLVYITDRSRIRSKGDYR